VPRNESESCHKALLVARHRGVGEAPCQCFSPAGNQRRRQAKLLLSALHHAAPSRIRQCNQRLPKRMRATSRARARLKRHACAGGPRWSLRLRQGVDAHRSREPIGTSFHRGLRTSARSRCLSWWTGAGKRWPIVCGRSETPFTHNSHWPRRAFPSIGCRANVGHLRRRCGTGPEI
jgi:hypothetical protein